MGHLRAQVRMGMFALLSAGLLAMGCGPTGGEPDPTGNLSVSAQGMAADVAGVLYEVVCEDGTTASQYVPLETEGLPPHVDPALAGESFADWFTVLPVGNCTVTATAMTDPDTPTEGCEPVSQDVTITEGETTEIVLVIVCDPAPVGALDVITVVTDGPSIIDLVFDPSKFILQCEEVVLTLTADGTAPLTYDWQVVGTPVDAVYTASFVDNVFTFFAETPGMYEVTVTVTDANGHTNQLTFPIHVSDDPNIEHCQEVCCQLPDGHVFFGHEPACEEAGGMSVPVDVCEQELCCKTPNGFQTIPAHECPQGAVVAAEMCDPTVEEVCCKLETIQIVPATDCPDGQVLPMNQCEQEEPICCLLNGVHQTMEPSKCVDAGGTIEPDDKCTETCCKLDDGTFLLVTPSQCESQGGAIASLDECTEVCCELPGGPQYVLLGNCTGQGGAVLPADACGQTQTHVWTADYTLDPTIICDPEPYLVVPSSGANQLAVYNTDTLTPLASTPFDTCGNPSRIMMDGNTDVYASCRSGGQVNKHTRDGVLLWSTQLTGCASARGITMSGNGRLFASCSDATNFNVYELDAATGAILGSVDVGHRIYGLAVDQDGIYVADLFTTGVSKINLGGALDMTVAWTVEENAYGITTDGLGTVWIGGSTNLRGLNTADGTVHTSVPNSVTVGGTPYTSYIFGLQAGLDGNIYCATEGGFFSKYDPVAGTFVGVALHTGATGNRGVTLDADNDVYSINRTSHDLTHTTPAGVSTAFGDDAGTVFLLSPYGYSGDMTGLTTTCLAGTTDTWLSAPINTGNPATTWLTISWSATTPPGSGVAVYYSIDGGVTWTQATNGQALGLTGATLQVKAILTSTIAGNEPTLNNVTVTYQ